MKKLSKRQIKHYVIVNLSYSLTHKLLKEKIYSQTIRNITEQVILYDNANIKLKAIINQANRYNLLHCLLSSSFLWCETPKEN